MQSNSDDNKTKRNPGSDVNLELGSRLSTRHGNFPGSLRLGLTLGPAHRISRFIGSRLPLLTYLQRLSGRESTLQRAWSALIYAWPFGLAGHTYPGASAPPGQVRFTQSGLRTLEPVPETLSPAPPGPSSSSKGATDNSPSITPTVSETLLKDSAGPLTPVDLIAPAEPPAAQRAPGEADPVPTSGVENESERAANAYQVAQSLEESSSVSAPASEPQGARDQTSLATPDHGAELGHGVVRRQVEVHPAAPGFPLSHAPASRGAEPQGPQEPERRQQAKPSETEPSDPKALVNPGASDAGKDAGSPDVSVETPKFTVAPSSGQGGKRLLRDTPTARVHLSSTGKGARSDVAQATSVPSQNPLGKTKEPSRPVTKSRSAGGLSTQSGPAGTSAEPSSRLGEGVHLAADAQSVPQDTGPTSPIVPSGNARQGSESRAPLPASRPEAQLGPAIVQRQIVRQEGRAHKAKTSDPIAPENPSGVAKGEGSDGAQVTPLLSTNPLPQSEEPSRPVNESPSTGSPSAPRGTGPTSPLVLSGNARQASESRTPLPASRPEARLAPAIIQRRIHLRHQDSRLDKTKSYGPKTVSNRAAPETEGGKGDAVSNERVRAQEPSLAASASNQKQTPEQSVNRDKGSTPLVRQSGEDTWGTLSVQSMAGSEIPPALEPRLVTRADSPPSAPFRGAYGGDALHFGAQILRRHRENTIAQLGIAASGADSPSLSFIQRRTRVVSATPAEVEVHSGEKKATRYGPAFLEDGGANSPERIGPTVPAARVAAVNSPDPQQTVLPRMTSGRGLQGDSTSFTQPALPGFETPARPTPPLQPSTASAGHSRISRMPFVWSPTRSVATGLNAKEEKRYGSMSRDTYGGPRPDVAPLGVALVQRYGPNPAGYNRVPAQPALGRSPRAGDEFHATVAEGEHRGPSLSASQPNEINVISATVQADESHTHLETEVVAPDGLGLAGKAAVVAGRRILLTRGSSIGPSHSGIPSLQRTSRDGGERVVPRDRVEPRLVKEGAPVPAGASGGGAWLPLLHGNRWNPWWFATRAPAGSRFTLPHVGGYSGPGGQTKGFGSLIRHRASPSDFKAGSALNDAQILHRSVEPWPAASPASFPGTRIHRSANPLDMEGYGYETVVSTTNLSSGSGFRPSTLTPRLNPHVAQRVAAASSRGGPSGSVPSIPGSSFPSGATGANSPPTQGLDINQLADHVYQLLVRRLASERDRKGM